MDPVAHKIMSMIARITIGSLMLAHVNAVQSLVARYAEYLERSHMAAIEDHMKAMRRLSESLSASGDEPTEKPS